MIGKKSQSKFGCFFTGCLGAAAALVLVIVVVLVGGYFLVEQYLDDFTDTKPLVFNDPLLSADEDANLKEKWETFKTQKQLELPTDPMELDSDQLNHLIRTDPAFSHLKDKVHVQITENIVSTQISIPASMVREVFPDIPNVGLIENRFFNATAKLLLRLENQELAVYLENLDIHGEKQIPAKYLNQLNGVDLLKDVRFAGEIKRQFGNLRELTVKNGKIMMVGSKGTMEEILKNR